MVKRKGAGHGDRGREQLDADMAADLSDVFDDLGLIG
jgi:hypothetical protein